MVLGKLSPSQISEVEVAWKDLTLLLNNARGATKTAEQWKRTFIEYKSKVRAKARTLKLDQRGTGGGKGTIPDLTDIEEKLMGILGWVSCDGDPMLPEAGLNDELNVLHEEDIIYAEVSRNELVVESLIEEPEPEANNTTNNKNKKQAAFKTKAQRPRQRPVRPQNLMEAATKSYERNSENICDAKLKITSINARYPGSTHDAAIWQMSNIQQHLRNKYFAGEQNGWLLGDSGYPLQPWLLTPIINAPEISPEGKFTKCHCRTRNTIERLNGVLKNRFRCLLKHRVLHYLPPAAGRIIYACAVLHNMCIERNDILGLDDYEDDDIEIMENDQHIDRDILANGQRIRNNVIQEYFN